MRLTTPIALGAATSAALLEHERRVRQTVERLGAAALETLLNTIIANDRETGEHVRRVAAYALVIADAADLPEHRQLGVERVALFHDIGKIYDALYDIVHTPSRLSEREWREIATHPARGAAVLAPLGAFYPELPKGILAHHERWDGSGYPRGLRGSHIPMEARIVSIADTFDSVAHSRRYRRGAGFDRALAVIAEGRATQFDPDLVDLIFLPPVTSCLVHTHVTPSHITTRRHARKHAEVPDIAFRWRSGLPSARDFATPRRFG